VCVVAVPCAVRYVTEVASGPSSPKAMSRWLRGSQSAAWLRAVSRALTCAGTRRRTLLGIVWHGSPDALAGALA
jgi:hypothetical protein